jgi:murein DD-endopeptidase MepM/ murein hydrolase activator NlpD
LNKFFTILFIPEKTNQVRKLIVPAAYLRIAVVLGCLGSFFVAFMVYDYVNVMQQLSENRKLVIENRQLRQKIQTFSNKLTSVEESLERIQTFATKLRIITNQGDEDTETLKEKVGKDIPGIPMDDHSVTPGTNIQFQRPAREEKQKSNDDFTQRRARPLTEAELLAQAMRSRNRGGMPFPISNVSFGLTAQDEGAIPPATAPPTAENSTPPATKTAGTQASMPTTATGESASDAIEAPELKKKAVSSVHRKRHVKISDLLQDEEDMAVDDALEKEFDRLYVAFQEIQKLSRDVEVDIQDLASTLLDQKDYLASMPTVKPSNGWYTSGFGMRSSPFTGLSAMHEGLDIANHFGQAIRSPADGVVSFAGVRPGYGKLITIDHGYGIQTQFGHISKFYVSEGQRVKRGQQISAIGNTGRSTGPHVHYEVRVNGIPVDPYFYILND